MKKFLFALILFISLARVVNAQTVDSLWVTPYICQAHVFEVKIFGTKADGTIKDGPQGHLLRNDTVYVHFEFEQGVGPAIPMPFSRQIVVPAPPIGRYKVVMKTSMQGAILQTLSSSLSVCTSISGVQETKQDRWEPVIFPNPVSDKVTLAWPGGCATVATTITEVTGKVLQARTHKPDSKVVLDLEDLPKGVYLLQIQAGNYLVTRKLVKQ